MSARVTFGLALLALAAFAPGCGGASGAAFAHVYPDNETGAVESVARRLADAGTPDEPAVAVGVAGGQLYAWDLAAGREMWREAVTDPRGEPHVAGPLVILHEGDRIVGHRLTDGRRSFDVSDDRFSLVGAAGEGRYGAFVLSTTGGVGAESRLYLTRGDGVAGQYDVEFTLGAPEVAAGMVFVPWGHQNVSVIDADSGDEIARLRTLAGVVGHARAVGGALFFGQSGVGRLRPGMIADGPEPVAWQERDVSRLPGTPPLWRNAYDPPASIESATHRIELSWLPVAEGEGVAFADDTIYLTFYKLVFGLAADDLSVRWVQQLDADGVGAAARPGGVVVADAAGGLSYLAASNGRPTRIADTGLEPTVVAFQLGSHEPSGTPGEEPPFLAEQLLAAAQNTDARLVPGRAFAVSALAAQPDDAVTGHIFALCDDGTLPQPLRDAACEALGTRDAGNTAVLRALGRHASFLEGTSAPPVGALATAAARMGERGAVPLLVGHLGDPDTPLTSIPALAAGLASLGDRSAVEPLRDFLWLYHADGEEAPLAAALGAVARAVVALDGPPGREAVQEILAAPFTSGTVRAALTEALAAPAEGEEESDDEG